MNWLWTRIQAEPNVVQGLVQAGFALACAYGFNLSAQQMGAALAFSAMALSFLTRQTVTPNSKLQATP